ncbi:MAG: hypothetical protein RL379_232 [Bacillota bacterium]|jgi:galactokinase
MIDKKTKASLVDKHILCFGNSPLFFIQTPLRIEWFGAYSGLHGSPRLTSAIDKYVYASVSRNQERVLRIISSHYPAINVSLDKPTIEFDKGGSIGLIQQLLHELNLRNMVVKEGFNMFIESDSKHGFHFGASSGFLLTILEAMKLTSKRKSSISHDESLQILNAIEQHQMIAPIHPFDSLSMMDGGTNLQDVDNQNQPISQRHQGPFHQYKIVSLSIQNFVYQAHLSIKHILEQMNIIAQHYQQTRLADIDFLSFQHDERNLSLLYGTKTIAKTNHFFQETSVTKQAFLALEKEDEAMFHHLFSQAQKRDIDLLEHHLVSTPSELKIASTMKWFLNTFPQLACRLHGFGFQADFLLLVPNDLFKEVFHRLKKQFYHDQVREIKIVNQGVRVFKS